MTDKPITGFTLKNVRLSYAHLFMMYSGSAENAKPKYQTAILLPKSNSDSYKILRQIAVNAGLTKWTREKLKAGVPDPLKGIRDGDVFADEKGEAYAGHWFFTVTSQRKPSVVEKRNGKLIPVNDGGVVSGDYCDVAIHAYPFDKPESKGVAFGFSAVLLREKGEPLGGSGVSADVAFADSEETAYDDSGWDDTPGDSEDYDDSDDSDDINPLS